MRRSCPHARSRRDSSSCRPNHHPGSRRQLHHATSRRSCRAENTTGSDWMNPKASMHVRVFDTTLRDGEQTPGVSLTPEEKLAIARQLARLGVDAIEAGFPVSSEGEAAGVRLIAKERLSPEVYALARANPQDIDAALQ